MAADLKTLAKYPFQKEAKDYIASLKMNLEEMTAHPAYSASVEKGRIRLTEAVTGRIHPDLSSKVAQELEIMSYAMARMIANATKNKTIIAKYAAGEAQNAYYHLRRESEPVVEKIMEDVGLRVEDGWLGFAEYTRLAKGLRDSKWRLVNRAVDKGRVRIENRNEFLELLREAVRLRIMEPLEVKNLPEKFRVLAESARNEFIGEPVEIKSGELVSEALPPCIKKMLGDLQAGAARHNEMFILGTFFAGLGLSTDDVVKVFSSSPKFDEEKTRYQLGFLSGEKGATKYSCPTCAKIKSYGLCRAECGIKHPIHHYRDKTKPARAKRP